LKIYNISKILFWGVMVLIVLLPVGRHWWPLSFGERVNGTVEQFTMHRKADMFGEFQKYFASEVFFPVDDSLVMTLGPPDYVLKPGKTIPVYYDRKDPADNCLFNFTCLYFTAYSILPMILIIVWYAFYLSFNNYNRRKTGKGQTPAFSPYTPFQKTGTAKNNHKKNTPHHNSLNPHSNH